MKSDIEVLGDIILDSVDNIMKSNNWNSVKLGNIGEIYLEIAIRQVMFEMGFNSGRRKVNTYTLTRTEYNDSIDYVLRVINIYGRDVEIFFESKNWNDYTHTQGKKTIDGWLMNILSKFYRNNIIGNRKVIMMNENNLDKERLITFRENDIKVLSLSIRLDKSISKEELEEEIGKSVSQLKRILSYKINPRNVKGKDRIRRDILTGKSNNFIGRKYDKSPLTIRNIRSIMRRDLDDVPRSKPYLARIRSKV